MIPAWCAPYIGLPFKEKGRYLDGYDCWGFVQRIFAERFGIVGLPDYTDAYTSPFDMRSVAGAITSGLTDGWERVSEPSEGTLVILLLAGRPWHCAIMADREWMLHMVRGANSVAERIDSMVWRGRIEGFYRRT